MISAGNPKMCICKESAKSKCKILLIDNPRPQPGQKSKPKFFIGQIEK